MESIANLSTTGRIAALALKTNEVNQRGVDSMGFEIRIG
jgi:hypothetical protein